MKLEGGFINNLSKVYGIYTLGFLGFVILMAILEQVGVSADAIGWMFVGFTIAIYALIGVLSRTMESGQYYVAGREVPAVFNGMATAADWMSGASFIAMAGGIYLKGYPYMAFLVGWTGGYVLVASLLAPYLRKFGCYTVPDFHWDALRRQLSSSLRRYCSGCGFVHLCDGANHRNWYRCIPCTEYTVQCGSLDWPCRHFILFNARRYARGDLDTGSPVHCADCRLFDSGVLDVKQARLWFDSTFCTV
jgi:hypothetical protein